MADDKTLEIVERLARIEAMLQSNIEILNSKASKSDLNALEVRVSRLESDKVWLYRAIGVLIIGSIASLIFVK